MASYPPAGAYPQQQFTGYHPQAGMPGYAPANAPVYQTGADKSGAPYGAPYGSPGVPNPYGYPAHQQYQPPPANVVSPAVAPVVVDVYGGQGGPGSGHAYTGESKYLDQLDKSVRLGFIRKVYSILSLQLLVTFGLVAIFTFSDKVKTAVQTNPGILYASMFLSFGFLIALACCPGVAKRYPTNMLCLAGFTLTEGYLVGAIASFYSTDAVIKAVAATFVITLALTAFAWQTKVDFTAMGGIMLCLLIVLIMFGIWVAIFPSQAARTAYAAVGAFIFSVFIVYDTQMIIGGSHHSHRFEVDDYVFAALNIYIDIVNLFLQMLKLFGSSRD